MDFDDPTADRRAELRALDTEIAIRGAELLALQEQVIDLSVDERPGSARAVVMERAEDLTALIEGLRAWRAYVERRLAEEEAAVEPPEPDGAD
ncbi:MAG: hypothetical protein JWM05_1159 [Acidimicrobiales bacterium]|nr:hypothetical protein [Acidimicrobiales bacterium]